MKRSTRICRTTILGLCAALPVSMALATTSAAADAPDTVTVRVDANAPGRVIPRNFLGLSFEANQLHSPWTDPSKGNVSALLHNLGDGNLRFSANQVDNSAWMPDPAKPAPAWAKGQIITPDDLTRVGDLAKSTGWSIDLGVNLKHFDPASAANQVAAAQQRIGNSLRSIQIGNEPNVYLVSNDPKTGLPRPYTPQAYVSDARAYRQAIHAADPTVPVAGPDTAGGAVGNPQIDSVLQNAVTPWLDAYTAAFGSKGGFLNQHYYPYVNTERLAQRVGSSSGSADLVGGMPTISGLLSRATADKQTTFIRSLVATADRAGMQPRLSETNSIAAEGLPGVTNSFGGALWTVDYLLTAAREGIAGADLHTQIDDCGSYSLICFPDTAAQRTGALQANPNYYGALLVSRLAGGAILPVTVQSGKANVTAFAVRMPDGTVKVAVDDKDRAFHGTVDVEIVGGNGRSASVERLTAAAPEATTGTEFAGATVGADGSFTPRSSEQATATDGHYRLNVGAPSAVLLSTH
ncbi:hypothetical protein G4X40_08700 [Rhodococcus sp. D2-41]|uniref:glycosyl hydrolase family 79 C-terminal domain-containing protein n=1 Tax=Speluncibacter jeojiensis TaxID=2710754 RepID=UPI00240EAABD|nr:glycosyl hydrolase family 79 C-terminal domain-containing protein [Rhodococcus sp. D2-41]MDG3010229.1 hypothetical protein [Rhodococcus sp. D2-41]